MSFAARHNRGFDIVGADESLIREASALDADGRPIAVARGDMFYDDGEETALKSELDDVPDDRWTQFVQSMRTADLDAVNESNGVGMFELTPRRLADLGLVQKLARGKSDANRTIWVAVFVLPLTCERFLKSPRVQYQAFAKSMRQYDDGLRSGTIERDPNMSRAGALAILHRAGPRGLETWKTGEKFPQTQTLFDRVEGIF